jgi:hypothetical protein
MIFTGNNVKKKKKTKRAQHGCDWKNGKKLKGNKIKKIKNQIFIHQDFISN